MCNIYKLSLLYKLPLNRAAGEDGILAEHILHADSSVCNYLNRLFSVYPFNAPRRPLQWTANFWATITSERIELESQWKYHFYP